MKQQSRVRWRARLALLGIGTGWLALSQGAEVSVPAGQPGVDWGDPNGEECVDCHMTESPGLYWEWNRGKHGQSGVNCLDCHKAKEGDPDAFMHEKALISIVVTPKDCARCHQNELDQMDGSYHAKAGQILASLDNLLGELVGGPEAVNAGCRQCHGAVMEFKKEGKHKGRPIPGTSHERRSRHRQDT